MGYSKSMDRVIMQAIIKHNKSMYLNAKQARNRVSQTQIIDAIVKSSGMHRKAVIRALNLPEADGTNRLVASKAGRPRIFTSEVDAALVYIWENLEYPCAERLIGEISVNIQIYQRDKMWNYSAATTALLQDMSLGTMKQKCVNFAHNRHLLRGQSTTKCGELIKVIPTFYGDWSTKPAGNGQVDTAVHCGNYLMGDMAYSLTFVDVKTYWQETVAIFNKSEVATLAGLEIIRDRLPFKLMGLHPDGGSEFINWLAYNWCKDRSIELTRSRPNKSNDNCHVEQRNLVVVRKYLGYGRYDCREAVDAMNEIYKVLRLFINYFQPTFKLVSKHERVDARTGKVLYKKRKRTYDQLKTPYQRALDEESIPQGVKDKLTLEYNTLNPKKLRDRIIVLTIKLERIQRDHGYSIPMPSK